MSRIRQVGGTYIKKVGGDYTMYASETINFKAAQTVTEEGVEEGEFYTNQPEMPPTVSPYFEDGWWSMDKEGEKRITRAVPGMRIYFHVQTKNIPDNSIVYMELYDDDINEPEEKNEDDHIELYSTTSNKRVFYEEVQEGKIVKVLRLDNFDQLAQAEADKCLELYFRCSYQDTHVELPRKPKDYLVVGTLVIDRYKMPGLNGQGNGIADDMTYGTGYPFKNKNIYATNDILQYKKDYTILGLNMGLHREFANIEPQETELKEIVITAKGNPKQEELLKSIPPMPMDNTQVKNLPKIPSFEEIEEFQRKQKEKNEKAIYTKEEIQNLGKLMNMTSQSKNESALWFDFRLMTQGLLSRGKLNDNISLMIDKMQRNEGGVFENKDLTDAVLDNPATLNYLQGVEDYIAEQLKTNHNKLEEVEDKEPYFRDSKNVFSNSKNDRKDLGKNFGSPAYSWKKDWNVLRGETIAINDVWAAEVILKEMEVNGEDYTIKYEVTLWDHFGLDKPDLEKFYSYGAGFRAWFALQHLWGYKPFLTKINFIKEMKGNFNTGSNEREKQRAQEQKEREEFNRKIQQEIWNGPKY